MHDETRLKENRRPLDGIQVVDFGHYVAGPLAGMLLADQGADVVKVDRPGSLRRRIAGPCCV